MEWINCEDRLPNLLENVLCYTKSLNDNSRKLIVCCRCLKTSYKYKEIVWIPECYCEYSESIEDFKVIAWMPLPKPPENYD